MGLRRVLFIPVNVLILLDRIDVVNYFEQCRTPVGVDPT
jgi:hypothetical protein